MKTLILCVSRWKQQPKFRGITAVGNNWEKIKTLTTELERGGTEGGMLLCCKAGWKCVV